MYAIRKSDLKAFPCTSQSVCRIEEGNTNKYLTNERAIEEFLLNVEPKYNASIVKLRKGNPDTECVLAIAGFVAYIGCCTPAAMRIHEEPLQAELRSAGELLDRQGLIPKAPPSLGGKSLTELLADGTVHHKIDPKFPQAIGIDTVVGRTSIYGNSQWEVLQNTSNDNPFFTSDYPLVLERTSLGALPNWIIPLAPSLAIRIAPDVRLSRKAPNLSFPAFSFRRRQLGPHEVRSINRLIVQCAEDIVFHRDDHDWISGFVAKHRRYRVSAVTERIPHGSGFLNVSTQRIEQIASKQ
jgi:hypothetical protein